MKKIPERTTDRAQPLHTYFNRQLKYFIEVLTERVRIDNMKIDIKNRLAIIKLFSGLNFLLNKMLSEVKIAA
jgi:hypothetical protein